MPTAATVAVFLALVIVGFGIFAQGFFSVGNLSTILAAVSVLMIASLGQLLVVISGGFDLSLGGLVPLTAVVFALLTSAGTPTTVSMLAAVAVGLIVGLIHTLFIVIMKINPLITTLATLSVTGGLAFSLAGGQTLAVPRESGILGEPVFGSIAWHILLMVALVVALHLVLQHTIFGRRIFMVGGNEEAARLAGVSVNGIGSSVYLISGALASLAGVVLASQLLSASGSIGSSVTLESLTAVVLGGAALSGGKGSVPGAVVGVLLLGVIANGMNILHIPTFYQQMVTGTVLLLAVSLRWWQERSPAR